MFRWLLSRLGVAVAGLALLVVVSKALTANMDSYYFVIMIQCGVAMTLAVSLNLINGITGQFSIGHAGFYAVGAYVGAAWTLIWQPAVVSRIPLLSMDSGGGEVANLIIAVALGAGAAGVAGLLVGLPSLRLRGDYLAIVTLGFGEVIRVVLLNIDAVGGARGLSGIRTLVSANDLAVFWVYALVVAAIVVTRNLMRSVRGLTWLAVREDEIAADAMGVNTTRVKVTAFILGSAFAGAAGVLYAHYFTGISPDIFGMDTSIMITTMVVLAGTGSVTGAVIAATALTALPEYFRFSGNYRMVIFSALLIVMMLTRPQGIFGHGELGIDSLLRRISRRKRRPGLGA